MLRGNNLSEDIGTRIDDTDLVFLDVNLAGKFSRSFARRGDLIFTCWGTVGQVGIIWENSAHSEYIVSNKQMKMTVDPSKVHPLYLYYHLSQPSMVDQVKSQSIGSSVPGFNLGQLKRIEVAIPDLMEQAAVVDILSALDDRIAANLKLTKTILELADMLYTRETQGVTASGPTFAEVANVSGGGTPKTGIDEYWGGDTYWATPTDVTALDGPYLESTARRITEAGLNSCASPLYPPGSILMTSRATIGSFAITQVPAAVNQGFIVVNPHDSNLHWWLFHEMRSRVEEFVSFANGATFLELSRGQFKKLRLRWTDVDRMGAFGIVANALHNRGRAALAENNLLANARDTLLPQLMSGRIRVKDAEERAAEVL